jgi:SnoaL-like domain
MCYMVAQGRSRSRCTSSTRASPIVDAAGPKSPDARVDAVESWELQARERIRDTLARYTWSGDAGRLDDLALAFSPDGVLEVRGQDPLRGRDAIVGMLGGVAATPAGQPGVRRIVRHNLANIRVTDLTPQHARVSSYFNGFHRNRPGSLRELP